MMLLGSLSTDQEDVRVEMKITGLALICTAADLMAWGGALQGWCWLPWTVLLGRSSMHEADCIACC